jgi:phosphoserine phosphatase
MKPAYIFDLDGTLALNEHRQHLLASAQPDKWRRFFAACVDDVPNKPVIQTMQALAMMGQIFIWSGRSDEVASQTVKWLSTHVGMKPDEIRSITRMRPAADHRPDHELKLSWLNELSPVDRQRLVAVFDDCDSMVAMWRANGIACFQVAPGAF